MKKAISLILAGAMTLTFASAAFSDVPETHWGYGEISVCEENGLLGGFSDGTFNPGDIVTRADAVKAVSADIPDWKADTSAITREEAVYLVMRGIKTENADNTILDFFKDNGEISEQYRESFINAVCDNIILGAGNKMLRPKSALTRAELAVLLYRAEYGKEILSARREKALEYMLNSTTLLWRPKTEITYTTKTGVTPEEADPKEVYTLYTDRIYSGVPYTHGGGSATSFLEYAVEKDENGVYVIDNLSWEAISGGRTYSSVGNDCSSSIILAWGSLGQVFPTGSGVRHFTGDNGIFAINGYDLPDELCTNTKAVVEKNGKDAIYHAYANAKPGDAVIKLTEKDGKLNSGHSRMIKQIDVVYLPDGEIDIENSMVHMVEQTSGSLRAQNKLYNEELGCDVYTIGIQQSFSFAAMVKASYIPVSPKILRDAAPVQDPVVTDSETVFNKDTVLKGRISSTWMMDNATMIISDKAGNEIQRCSKNTERDNEKYVAFDLQEFVTADPSFWRGKIDLNALEAGTYNCKLIMRLVTGEEITIRNFDFEI